MNLPAIPIGKINEAIENFIGNHGSEDLQPGTTEWDTAVDEAVVLFQLQRCREDFVSHLENKLAEKLNLCIRDHHKDKCKEGPWTGRGCSLCGKTGTKLGLPAMDVPATR